MKEEEINYEAKELQELEDAIMNVVMDEDLWGDEWDAPKKVTRLKNYISDNEESADKDYIADEMCEILQEEGLTQSTNNNVMGFYAFMDAHDMFADQ